MFNSRHLNSGCTFTLRGTGFKKNWLWSMQESEAVFIGWKKLTLIRVKNRNIFHIIWFSEKKLLQQKVTNKRKLLGKSVDIKITTYCWFTKSDHSIWTKFSHFPSTLSWPDIKASIKKQLCRWMGIIFLAFLSQPLTFRRVSFP